MNRLENQTLALAAMFQSATLVNELALHGRCDSDAFTCSFDSLFTIDADTTRAMAALGTPVNVLAAGAMRDLSTAEMGALGAARISIGGGLARVTHQTIIDATRAMLENGDFTILKNAANAADVEAMLAD